METFAHGSRLMPTILIVQCLQCALDANFTLQSNKLCFHIPTASSTCPSHSRHKCKALELSWHNRSPCRIHSITSYFMRLPCMLKLNACPSSSPLSYCATVRASAPLMLASMAMLQLSKHAIYPPYRTGCPSRPQLSPGCPALVDFPSLPSLLILVWSAFLVALGIHFAMKTTVPSALLLFDVPGSPIVVSFVCAPTSPRSLLHISQCTG